ISATAVAADAGHDFLMHVRHQGVRLGRRRVGMDGGGVVSAARGLISIGIGSSAVSLREPVGLAIGAGVPAGLLVNVVAGIRRDAAARRSIGGIEAEHGLIDDV